VVSSCVPEGAVKAAAILLALRQAEQPELDDVAQRRLDAQIGRALRAAIQADRDEEPLIHVSWTTPTGRTSGRYLGDPHLHFQRREMAHAAIELLEHLGFDLDDTTEATPSPTTDPSETAA
jgi:hypothetical protein